MSLTTYAANKLLDHMSGKTSYTMPDVFLALFTTAPNVSGGGTECIYTGYARIDVTGADFAAASGSANTNANTITFGTKTGGADETVTHWATYDAITAGNMLEFGSVLSSRLIQTGDAPRFLAGDFDRSAS
jgi:hypothetical protein